MLQVWRRSLPGDFIVPKLTEKILLCGWRRDMEDMIMVILCGIQDDAPTLQIVTQYQLLTPRNLHQFQDSPLCFYF